MKIKPDELKNEGYVLMDSLGHKELIPFVRKYLKKKTKISLLYTIVNIAIAIGTLFWFWKNYEIDGFSIGNGIIQFSYGMALAFGLIPLHEYIHVLAYKSQGAKNTSYDANLKKFFFMAIADKFVACKKEFQIVALAPFAVISSILLVLLLLVSNLWVFTILGILLTHTAFTSGDFGLISYFEFHNDKEIVTYDDKSSKISYFYQKNK